MIGDAAGGLSEAEALKDSTGGGRVPEGGRAGVEGRHRGRGRPGRRGSGFRSCPGRRGG